MGFQSLHFLLNKKIYMANNTPFVRYFDLLIPLNVKWTISYLYQYVQENMKRVQSKLGCKEQESIQSRTTPDPGYQWESNTFTIRHHKREPRGQPFLKSKV